MNPSSFANSRNAINVNKNKKRNNAKKAKVDVMKYQIKTDYIEQSEDKLKEYRMQTEAEPLPKGRNNIYNQKNKKELEVKKINQTYTSDKYENIKYRFNMCEIIFTSLCKCCLMKNLRIKNDINKKANNILNNSLDIVCFVRNHMLFNIIRETILYENIKSIVNFLCRPVISIDNDNKIEYPEFYQSFKDGDFEKFSDELLKLNSRPKKEVKDNKLIFLANKHLTTFSNNNIN